MKPEQKLWRWLADRLPTGHYTRIESEVSDGFPDVHGTPRGCRSCTLELKYADGPKRQPLKDKIRQSQKLWIRDEVAAGGLVWVVAEFPKHDSLVLFLPGSHVDIYGQLEFPDLQHYADLSLAKRCRPEITRVFIEGLLKSSARIK